MAGGGALKEHPALVPTALGTAGAVVAVPDGPVRSAVAVLQGRSDDRSGVNGMWARLARELAEGGAAVLRLDYPGSGDSMGIPRGWESDIATLNGVMAWFLEQARAPHLLMVGSCYGARLASVYAIQAPDVTGLGLVLPAFRATSRRLPARARRALGRALGRAHPLDHALLRGVSRLARRAPVWILAGEADVRNRVEMAALQRVRGREGLPFELELVPGIQLHAFRTLEAQEATTERLARWTARVLEQQPVSSSA